MNKASLLHFLAYASASDKIVLEALQNSTPKTPVKAWEIFSHVLNAYEIWLSRLEGRPSRYGLFQVHEAAQFAARLSALHGGLQTYLDACSPEKLNDAFVYTSTEGDTYSSRRDEVFLHLVNHGSYHRGQVSTLLRQAGCIPKPTDYILHTRKVI